MPRQNKHNIPRLTPTWLRGFLALENMKVNGKDDIPYMKWKIKNVPNHHSMEFYCEAGIRSCLPQDPTCAGISGPNLAGQKFQSHGIMKNEVQLQQSFSNIGFPNTISKIIQLLPSKWIPNILVISKPRPILA